jgi:beta-glucosidase
MNRIKKINFAGLLLIIAYVIPMQAQELYKNEDAPLHERIMDLLSRLIRADFPAYP